MTPNVPHGQPASDTADGLPSGYSREAFGLTDYWIKIPELELVSDFDVSAAIELTRLQLREAGFLPPLE